MASRPFKELFAIPLRNGLTKPKAVRGAGTKMVNMGELFANPRIVNVAMDRVPLNQAERSSSLLAAGDLLFARQSLVLSGAGKCSIFVRDDENVCFESHVIRCRVSQELADPHFYYYFFSSPAGRALMESIVEQGAGASGIRGSDLAELSVPWIDPIFQRRVAGVLSQIDDKISFNRRIIQTLEAMAQAIFQSWFVDFDPVKAKIAAKAEGRDPLRAAMSVISGKAAAELDALPPEQREQLAATAALFPDEMEESEVEEVPKGWSVGTLSNFASFQNGYAFKTKDWTDSGHPVVKIGNVKPGIIDLSGCSLVAHETVNGLDRFALKKGDLLVGMTGYVGETGLVPALYSVAYLNQRVGRISTVNGVSDIGYPFCLVRDPAYKAYAESKAHGSAQANVSGKDLMDYQAVVPDAGVLKIFNAQVAKIINALLSYHEENQSLAALRDTLLPRLLSGELLVADAMAEAVA